MNYCKEKKVNLFKASISEILEFLIHEFNKGRTYTIPTYDFTFDNRIKIFFKDIYGLRPSQPKYDVTWDPSTVLRYARDLDNNTLQKLSILLAPATQDRSTKESKYTESFHNS